MDEIFDTKALDDRARNRKCFMKILQVIRLLAQRNIPLVDKETRNSNVYHFTKLRALDDPDLEKWLEKKRGIYLHHEIITELVDLMAMKVLREKILRPIQRGNDAFPSKSSQKIGIRKVYIRKSSRKIGIRLSNNFRPAFHGSWEQNPL